MSMLYTKESVQRAQWLESFHAGVCALLSCFFARSQKFVVYVIEHFVELSRHFVVMGYVRVDAFRYWHPTRGWGYIEYRSGRYFCTCFFFGVQVHFWVKEKEGLVRQYNSSLVILRSISTRTTYIRVYEGQSKSIRILKIFCTSDNQF